MLQNQLFCLARAPLLVSTSDTGERSARIPRGNDCRGTFMGLDRQAHQLFVLTAMDGMCGIRFTEIAKQDCDPMDPREHIRVTGFALKNWAVAQMQDSIAVALLWLVGLWILKVPWAPLWAVLAAALQIVPHLGPVLS